MAEQSTHINYTLDDIQRYLQGKMSAREMHLIEKAALQDLFLADAIEGYREISAEAAKQYLNEIITSLISQRKKSKVVFLSQKNYWWKIAALIIILAGVGVIGSYVLKKSNQQEQITQLKESSITNKNMGAEEDSAKNKTIPAPFINESKPDSNQIKINIKQQEIKKSTEQILLKANESANQQSDSRITLRALASKQVYADKEEAYASGTSIEKIKDTGYKKELSGKVAGISILPVTTFSGKVIDENNNPISNVVIESNDKKQAVITDALGYFLLKKDDSLLNVSASSIGYTNTNAVLKKESDNIISLKENNSSFNNAVVVGYGIKRSKTSGNQAAAPVGGWENFNQYVNTSLQKEDSDENHDNSTYNSDQLVELEFSIDQSGNPYNFKFIQSLDEKRNLKALEILKEGPKWMTMSKNKSVHLKISFE